jgi:ASCH domain
MSDDTRVRALSVQQPWAWLIVNGYKDIENRDWPTSVRGQVFIHAGKKFDAEGERFVRRHFPEIPLPPRERLEFGGIVGETSIVDCIRRSSSPWFSGIFGFVCRGSRPLAFKPMRGMLGFFPVPPQ